MSNQLHIIGNRVFGPKLDQKMAYIRNWFIDHPDFEHDFLRSLLDQYDQCDSLSEKQWEFLKRIALESK